jgi:hypothetical protein
MHHTCSNGAFLFGTSLLEVFSLNYLLPTSYRRFPTLIFACLLFTHRVGANLVLFAALELIITCQTFDQQAPAKTRWNEALPVDFVVSSE